MGAVAFRNQAGVNSVWIELVKLHHIGFHIETVDAAEAGDAAILFKGNLLSCQ